MASIQIINDLSCIKLVVDGQSLHIHKKLIKTIDVLHNDTVRIDIGEGPLRHVFIKHSDVTQPAMATVAALRDAVKAMLDIDDEGLATASNQVTQIGLLNNIKDGQTSINNALTALETGQNTERALLVNANDVLLGMRDFIEHETSQLDTIASALADIKILLLPVSQSALGDPSRMDESEPATVYYGYAAAGTLPGAAAWAIKRVVKSSEVILTEWADGNQNMDNIWDNRHDLNYQPLG